MANPRGNPQNFRPFPKGKSGNPSGKPKDTEHVRELARQHTRDSIEALVRIVRKGKSESAVATAAEVLLSRGWGKPLQQIEVKRTPFDELSPEELRAVAEALEALTAEQDGSVGGYPGSADAGQTLSLPAVRETTGLPH